MPQWRWGFSGRFWQAATPFAAECSERSVAAICQWILAVLICKWTEWDSVRRFLFEGFVLRVFFPPCCGQTGPWRATSLYFALFRLGSPVRHYVWAWIIFTSPEQHEQNKTRNAFGEHRPVVRAGAVVSVASYTCCMFLLFSAVVWVSVLFVDLMILDVSPWIHLLMVCPAQGEFLPFSFSDLFSPQSKV